MNLPRLLSIAAIFSAVSASPLAAESPAVRIYANHSGRIAYIQTIGTLYNDTIERNAGSGLLVGDRLIVTNNHLIPEADNFRTLQISVRLGARSSALQQISAIKRDPERDLAVLKLAQPVALANNPACPVPLLDHENIIPIGSSVFVLGYPVDQDLSITDGIISNKSGPRGRWQTNTPINPGNSGGPAFGESGILIGFAVSGIVQWQHGDEVITIQGVNFVIPAYSLLQGPLAQLLEDLPPPPQRCWRLASAPAPLDLSALANTSIWISSLQCTTSFEGIPTCHQSPPIAPNIAELPQQFSHSFTVARIKDDHPNPLERDYRRYQEDFNAEPGYRIGECRSQTSSANNADEISCIVREDRRKASLRFRLASGPAFDRFRGWLQTTVTLLQKRE